PASTGRYFDMGPSNAKCLFLMEEIITAERELAGITEEKRAILAEAGLTADAIYISLNELPTTQTEYNIRLHGVRDSDRTNLMRAMIAAGLVKKFEFVGAAA